MQGLSSSLMAVAGPTLELGQQEILINPMGFQLEVNP